MGIQMACKILKPVYANLRQKGRLSVVFVDDSYLQGHTETECLGNVEAKIALLKYLDFTIHEAKSILKPTHQIEFLDFIIDSTKMTVTISKDKMIAITNKIKKLLATTFPTGKWLKKASGSFDKTVANISVKAIDKLNSWLTAIYTFQTYTLQFTQMLVKLAGEQLMVIILQVVNG